MRIGIETSSRPHRPGVEPPCGHNLTRQDHVEARHRRAVKAAGRPYQDLATGCRHRLSRFDNTRDIRRERGDAHP
jgi:hypothetical protein